MDRFLQDRLASEQDLVKGALWTAVPFALIHLPMAFEEHGLTGTGAKDLAMSWAFLLVSRLPPLAGGPGLRPDRSKHPRACAPAHHWTLCRGG